MSRRRACPGRSVRSLALPLGLVTLAAGFIAACGGGGGGADDEGSPGAAAITLPLKVSLVSAGTYVECSVSAETSLRLVRSVEGTSQAFELPCPGRSVVPGDWTPARWRVHPIEGETVSDQVLAEALTEIPAPLVIADGNQWIVLPRDPSIDIPGTVATLETIDEAGTVSRLLADVDPDRVITLSKTTAGTQGQGLRWRWSITQGDAVFESQAVMAAKPVETDLGMWGALAVGDAQGDGRPVLAGTAMSEDGTIRAVGYGPQGLDPTRTGRMFRDLRFADFNGDGLDDVVSNVYGEGCAMVGLRRRDGAGYDFTEPTLSDGSCISGHGETILVADFDGDGAIDVILPSYERFHYLRNLGDGRFVEEAASRGILLADYLPKVEGAAAVDLDLDGDIDIVAVSEVMINDGTGHFSRMPTPFGAGGLFDEGLSVVDLDRDGAYDIVKHHPEQGPRFYWGQAQDLLKFVDGGFLFGGTAILSRSYGVATGALMGRGVPDLLLAGGDPKGAGPRLCVQQRPRQFHCMKEVFPPTFTDYQELLMLTDLSGDGLPELVARGGTLHTYAGLASTSARQVFRFDLRDAQGRRNMHGTSLVTRCAVDESLVEMKFVDGGNGFMAQGNYLVDVASDWCPAITVDVATRGGLRRLGPFVPGTHRIDVAGS